MKNTTLTRDFIKNFVQNFLKEDGYLENFHYINSLPDDVVNCQLKIKSDLLLAGLPYFFEVFNSYLSSPIDYKEHLENEGKYFTFEEKKEIHFQLPFSVALTLERIALNLLNRMSSIATTTRKFSDIAAKSGTKILDTRKTTPGLRAFEKYAVRVGGGYNHRMHQIDVWMVKDNHKSFFGGLEGAINFFKSQGAFYNSMVVEIHDLKELKEGIKLGVRHFMLDNFSPSEVKNAIEIKPPHCTFEVSGGINLETVGNYSIKGVDVISVGMLTYAAQKVDLSLKYQRA